MSSVVHQYEDKLLEFAYGELSAHEAAAVDAHVRGCTKCSEALSHISSVRKTMSQLPVEPAPEAGLDSLLAYAEQHATRNTMPREARPWWRRFMMPVASVMALLVVGVVAYRAQESAAVDPAAPALEKRRAELAATAERKPAKEEAYKDTAPAAAAQEQVASPAPAVANAAPQPPPPPAERERPREDGKIAQANAKTEGAPPARDAPTDSLADGTLTEDRAKSLAVSGERKQNTNELDLPYGKTAAPKGDVTAANQGWDSKPKGSQAYRQSAPQEEKPVVATKRAAPQSKKDVAVVPLLKELSKAEKADKREDRLSDEFGAGRMPSTNSAPEQWGRERSGQDDVGAVAKGGFGLSTGTAGAGGMKTRGGSGGPATNVPAKPSAQVAAATPLVAPEPAQAPPAPVTVAPGALAYGGSAKAPDTANDKKSAPSKLGLMGSTSSLRLGPSPSSASGEEQLMDDAERHIDSNRANKDAEVAQKQRQKSLAAQLDEARAAESRRDSTTVIKLCSDMLNRGADGAQRAEALRKLCDAYDALENPDQGQRYCDALVDEFPNTLWARQVTERRTSQRLERAPAKSKSKAYEFDADQQKSQQAPRTLPTAK